MTSPSSFLQRQPPLLRAALAAAAAGLCLVADPATAGQAGANFQISVTLMPSGSNSCTTATGTNAPQVTCRPTVVGTPTTGTGNRPAGSTVLAPRQREPALRVAGEMVEINEENHYAWAESNYFALGEYSSRLIVAGRIEYVELTVSW
ncbi:hypothetical protein [Ramlibacter montanisoli]|uniref:Uncharacterized protein n=1 Tax=Ramlibacter montanisoli TaxID=2732512 RepID=A0A849KAQ9_9BURK|nr:hypothetical protein [Ramlibacter montanisoli]NNU44520.1 hypothetical protein [Ramlibacter montanisoli]